MAGLSRTHRVSGIRGECRVGGRQLTSIIVVIRLTSGIGGGIIELRSGAATLCGRVCTSGTSSTSSISCTGGGRGASDRLSRGGSACWTMRR